MKTSNINPIAAVYLSFNSLTSFAISFIAATYVPFLTEKGMNLWQINAINACFMISIFLAEIPTGSFADCFGRHRSLALSCFFLSLSFIIYYFSKSFYIFILAEIVGAIGQTFASGADEAWLVDSLKNRNELHLKDRIFRQRPIVRSLSIIVGCLLGSALGNLDLSLPWIASSAFMFLSGIYALIFIKENYASEFKEIRQKKSISQQIKIAWHSGLKNKELLYVMGLGMIIAFSVQAINMQWTLILKDKYNFSSIYLGMFFVGVALSIAAGSILSKQIDKITRNKKLALIISQLITAIFIIICSQTETVFVFTSAFLLHEVGRGIFEPLKQSYINDFLESDKRATLLSLESMFVKLGAFLGLIISGLIAEAYSINLTWLLSGIFLALGTIIFILISQRKFSATK